MTNIILNGCSGKMGKVITELAKNDLECQIVAGFDINKTDAPFPIYQNIFECSEKADVIIDFSHPSCIENLCKYAKNTKTPIIFCTTGLSDVHKQMISELSKEVAVFYSANMSIGVNLLISLAQKASTILGEDFDIEIIEKHHNQKLDAPSGTALAIADGICEVSKDGFEYVYDRHSKRAKRTTKEIGIHSIRGGTIVGEHDVLFAGNNEVITLSHQAQSREVFATGAIRAAKFLKDKPSGMYSMKELVESI